MLDGHENGAAPLATGGDPLQDAQEDEQDRRGDADGGVRRQHADQGGGGAHEHELPRLPERAVHEAIANAVIHRSFEPGTGPVRVEIHPEGVVVRSPGALPGAVTLDNLRQQHAPRNPALAQRK